MLAQVLPLAITMMAGPQIIAAIIFVTTRRPVRVSLAFLLGILVATTAGVAIMRGLAALLGGALRIEAGTHGAGTLGVILQIVLVSLLILAAAKSYLRRKTAEPPAWLGHLLRATPAMALRTGVLLVLVMPSDLAIMLTVGLNLHQHDLGLAAAAPFVAATLLVAALPLLAYLLCRQRAASTMPAVRDWMSSHSWLVNIVVYLVFIALIVFGG